MNRKIELPHLGDRLSLPALPDIVARINAMLEDPLAAGVVVTGAAAPRAPSAEEQGLTVKVLSIANTPHFGLQSPVTTLDEAAASMGVRSLRNIAVQVALKARFEKLAIDFEYDIAETTLHATFVGELSQALGLRLERPPELDPEELYMCGLLHDIGKLVLLESLRDDYYAVYLQAKRERRAIHLTEQQSLGFTHADVGAAVLTSWHMPEPMTQAVHFHHGPRAELLDRPAAAILAIVDQVGYRIGTRSWAGAVPRLTVLAKQALGLDAHAFRGFLEYAQSMRAQVAGG